MQTSFSWAILILAAAAAGWILWRVRTRSRRGPTLSGPIVNADAARVDPYPYVFVNADGSARELHPSERKHLETPFHPADGGRPYVKRRYSQKNGWGEIDGLLERSKLPHGTRISAAPEEDPLKTPTREERILFLRAKGVEVVENSDGTFTARTKPLDGSG
jgi:hypothetical protein